MTSLGFRFAGFALLWDEFVMVLGSVCILDAGPLSLEVPLALKGAPYPDKSIRFGPRALRAPDLEPFIDMADNSTTSSLPQFQGVRFWGIRTREICCPHLN